MSESNHSNYSELVDKYLLHQLSDEEENQLEEHLLFCEECQKTLEIRKSTINVVRQSVTGINQKENGYSFTKKGNGSRPALIFFKVAASIAIVLSITYIINELYFKDYNLGEPEGIATLKDTNQILNTHKNLPDKLATNNDSISKQELFKELSQFENNINNALRSDNLEVFSPSIGQVFKANKKIEFRWKFQSIDTLHLAIFNNQAKIVYEKWVPKIININPNLIPGLYYWQLETQDEAMYTGKFFIEK